jgi:hypothetical protein
VKRGHDKSKDTHYTTLYPENRHFMVEIHFARCFAFFFRSFLYLAFADSLCVLTMVRVLRLLGYLSVAVCLTRNDQCTSLLMREQQHTQTQQLSALLCVCIQMMVFMDWVFGKSATEKLRIRGREFHDF